jgi:scaffold protein (connect acetoacetyl-CoA thiolase and HMG-CoA synthase)
MEINIRRCGTCNNAYLDDVDICPECAEVTITQREEVAGTGTIYSYTRVHVAPEQFKNIVPYYLAIVELSAGPRVMGRLKTVEGDNVRIDAPVELVSTENGCVFALK